MHVASTPEIDLFILVCCCWGVLFMCPYCHHKDMRNWHAVLRPFSELHRTWVWGGNGWSLIGMSFWMILTGNINSEDSQIKEWMERQIYVSIFSSLFWCSLNLHIFYTLDRIHWGFFLYSFDLILFKGWMEKYALGLFVGHRSMTLGHIDQKFQFISVA